MLADGTIFELVEDATYKNTAPESGGKNASHKDAKYWDYFIKTVIVDGKAYDVLISVRLDNTAGNLTKKERYVCSIRFRDNKTAATSVASPASSKVLHQGDVAAVADMVSEDQPVVKKISTTDSDNRRNRLAAGPDLSARTLLTDPTVEGKNDAQKLNLQRYRDAVEKADGLEAHLKDVEAQYKEMSTEQKKSAEGKELRAEINKTKKRLNMANEKVRKLEAPNPFCAENR